MRKNVYLVMAMKRSGHHALINWICTQNGNITHFNNVVSGWEHGNFNTSLHAAKTYGVGHDLCINIEDFDIDDYKKFNFSSFKEVEKGINFYPIVFIRDFKNWIASSLKRRDANGVYRDVYEALDNDYINDRKDKKPSRIKLWSKQINLFDVNPHNLILVSYPQWVQHISYREKIANKLNLNFTDGGYEHVSTFGKGSSFDGTSITNINKLDILNRYKVYENDEEFNDLLIKNKTLGEKSDNYLLTF